MLNGAVAFLDVLGFKGIWKRYADDPGRVLRRLAGVEDRIQQAGKNFATYGHKIGWRSEFPEIRVIFISDSIFITCKAVDDTPEQTIVALLSVSFLAGAAMAFGALGDVPLIYRGAISVGKYLAAEDKPFVVGPAIDDAASVENLAQGAFVWLTPGACETYEKHKKGSLGMPWLRRYEVPLKGLGAFSTWAVDPLKLSTSTPKMRDEYIGKISTAMTVDSLDVLMKRNNTLAFYKEHYEGDVSERAPDGADKEP